MANYRLRYTLNPPSQDTAGLYMAEIPSLPGCSAWAETPEEALDILVSVAREFIASYEAHDDTLPPDVQAARDSEVEDGLLVAV